MKRFDSAPKKNEKRFRPFRLIIACTLIAILLVSTSIGLTYARYNNIASATDHLNFLGNNFIHADNVVITYINRTDNTAPTVLNYNDDIVVTVPRGLAAESESIAYALIVKEFKPAAYDVVSGEYKASAKLQLVGLSYPTDTVVYNNVYGSGSDMIDVKVKVENTANVFESASVDSFDHTPDKVTAAAGSENVTYADFTSVNNLGTKDASSSSLVSVSYSKVNWAAVANTSWYDENSTATEIALDSATKLAGLAKLVNNGKDFAGVTFKLSSDINLFGSSVTGDRREWTPIGTAEHPFKGNFDGNGKTVTGLTLSGANAAENVGLFGVVDGTEASFIKDFKLDAAMVYGKEDNRTGAVVGKATGYKVSDIEMTDLDISGADNAVIGLIAGQVNGTFEHNSCTIDTDAYDFVGEVNRSSAPAGTVEVTSVTLAQNSDSWILTAHFKNTTDTDAVYNKAKFRFDDETNGKSFALTGSDTADTIAANSADAPLSFTKTVECPVAVSDSIKVYYDNELVFEGQISAEA